jgi:hypothetical protein
MNKRRSRHFADYFGVARRRKLILIIPMLVLDISTALSLKDLPNLYESQAGMRLTSANTSDSSAIAGHVQGLREHLDQETGCGNALDRPKRNLQCLTGRSSEEDRKWSTRIEWLFEGKPKCLNQS